MHLDRAPFFTSAARGRARADDRAATAANVREGKPLSKKSAEQKLAEDQAAAKAKIAELQTGLGAAAHDYCDKFTANQDGIVAKTRKLMDDKRDVLLAAVSVVGEAYRDYNMAHKIAAYAAYTASQNTVGGCSHPQATDRFRLNGIEVEPTAFGEAEEAIAREIQLTEIAFNPELRRKGTTPGFKSDSSGE